jgi:hypothetical protein
MSNTQADCTGETREYTNKQTETQKPGSRQKRQGWILPETAARGSTRRHRWHPAKDQPPLTTAPPRMFRKKRSVAVTHAKEQRALWRVQTTRRTLTTGMNRASVGRSGRRWGTRLRGACLEKSNGVEKIWLRKDDENK